MTTENWTKLELARKMFSIAGVDRTEIEYRIRMASEVPVTLVVTRKIVVARLPISQVAKGLSIISVVPTSDLEKALSLVVGQPVHVSGDQFRPADLQIGGVAIPVMPEPSVLNLDPMGLHALQERCHAASYAAGWWHHPNTGLPYIPGDVWRNADGSTAAWDSIDYSTQQMIIHYWPFVLATKTALIHSETSEGLEAVRRNLMDDHLPHRIGFETEMADSMIRIADMAGAMSRAAELGIADPKMNRVDLGGAVQEKMGYNAVRPDHQVAARRKFGGKYF